MISEIFQTAYQWCFKYRKGIIVFIIISIVIELIQHLLSIELGLEHKSLCPLINKAFGGRLLVYWTIITLLETWISLGIIEYIYKGEQAKNNHELSVFYQQDFVKVLAGTVASLALLMAIFLPVMGFLYFIKISKIFGEPGKGLLISAGIISLVLFPFSLWFVLRSIFFLSVMVVDLKQSPFDAIMGSYFVTKNELYKVFIILVAPVMITEFCFSSLLKVFDSAIFVLIGIWICRALLSSFITCASLRLYLVLRDGKKSISIRANSSVSTI